MAHYIGVDVGTASVRAALVSSKGEVVQTAVEPIEIHNPQPGYYEQSSEDIWRAVCLTIRKVVTESEVASPEVKGIGFDATCSLVALDDHFRPVSCSTTGDDRYNIIMWMDHRAEKEAAMINSTKHDVLRYCGGVMSLEMQPPKLLWLKKHMPDQWKRMAHLFDLPDFLTWRATGSLSRSLCSVVCKWGYEIKDLQQHGWNDDFLRAVGLGELAEDNHSRIGGEVSMSGRPCGSGLQEKVSHALRLQTGTAVGVSQIDAHAGAVGCLACDPRGVEPHPITQRLVLICGTSTCHMVISSAAHYVPGVWGPYFSTTIPGSWTSEGGQSATGKLIDFVVEGHSAFAVAKSNAEKRGLHVYQHLNSVLDKMASRRGVPVSHLTKDLHVFPDFHGNRSPLADPTMKGMVCGLTLSNTEEDLACLYLATIQALTYETRHILEEMNKNGHDIQIVYMCGGLRKNPLFVQTHADALGLPVVLPDAEESVLLGAAMLGMCAAEGQGTFQNAMQAMGGGGQVVKPTPSEKPYHEKKHAVYLRMLSDQKAYAELMKD